MVEKGLMWILQVFPGGQPVTCPQCEWTVLEEPTVALSDPLEALANTANTAWRDFLTEQKDHVNKEK